MEHSRPDQSREPPASAVLDSELNQTSCSDRPIRLVACDIDGTLLDSSGTISRENRHVIRSLAGQDIAFTLVTGRMDRMTRPYVRQLGVTLPVIACNGAIIRDCASETILSRTAIAPDDVQTIVFWLQRKGLDFLCYTADAVYYPPESRRILHFRAFNERLEREGEKIIDLFQLDDAVLSERDDFIKLLAVLPDRPSIGDAHRMLREETRCTGTLSNETALDIMTAGVTKGRALAVLAGWLKIDMAEVAAIGDHDNDVTMLKAAGLGIAMADASPAALEAAGRVAGSHHESGVARAICQYVLHQPDC